MSGQAKILYFTSSDCFRVSAEFFNSQAVCML